MPERNWPARAAYGLRLHGPLIGARVRSLLPDDPGPWPDVRVAWAPAALGGAREEIGDDRAIVHCLFGGHLAADRRAMSATFCDPARPAPDLVVHPGLAGVGVIFARWLGRSAFHGGAVLAAGQAWGVVGAKGSGKTTTLAALSRLGHQVLADDLVVLDGGRVLSGPRALDLRPAAAARLPGGVGTVAVRDGERRRLALGPAVASAPLAGWILLEEAPRLSVTRVRPAERLAVLAEHLAVRLVPADPAAFLDLASRPAYRIGRPLAWDALPEVVAAVSEITRRARPRGPGPGGHAQ